MRRFFCYLLISISSLLLFSCSQDSQIVEKEQPANVMTEDSNHSRWDVKMIVLIIVMIIYLAPLTWLVERLVRTKNNEIKDLSLINDNLETQKNSLAEEVVVEQNQNILLNEELRKLRSDYEELHQIKKSENRTLKQLLQRIDAYSARLYLTPKAKAGMDLRSDTYLKEIDNMIDGYSKGFIDAVKESFPKMKPSRLRLVRYLYAGFSTETMMYLFGYDNRAKLDNGKWLLKRSILENANWHNLDPNTMLSKLNYKL